jgi:thiol:disulfide interchange protein DsbD
MTRGWLAAVGLALAAALASAAAQPVSTAHVTAELVAERSAVQPGQPIRIGLRLQHQPHWHTYWRNPGDSGLPTTLSWTLPALSQIDEIVWPVPRRLWIGPLVNYGFEGELLLPQVYLPAVDAHVGSTLKLQAVASWLVCKEVCIPETVTLALQLPVVSAAGGVTPGGTEHAALFERAAAAQPVPLDGWTVDVQHAGRDLLVGFARSGAALSAPAPLVHVFPYAEQLLETAAHEAYRTDSGYAIRLRLLDDVTPPDVLRGIAVAQGEAGVADHAWGGTQRAVEFSAPVRAVPRIEMPAGAQPLPDAEASAALAAAAAADAGPVPPAAGADLGWAAALLLAFLGGMVLNLMPCVFPVLSIKLLSLSQTPRGDVLLSFVALAVGLLALRAAGSAIGWGFQLQEPAVVSVLALLFLAIGLNLLGVFEVSLLLPQRLIAWRDERPAVDALASGVLAVVAASPCTAPFMGAALGFAITQPAAVGLSVFAVLGLGMALPYVLLVLMPGWRARLPRPGAWMLRLRQVLALPMFLTVAWLLWVLAQQTGWIGDRTADADRPTAASRAEVSAWQPYDEAVIASELAAGRRVFVDFTAAWCVSCQVNERLVLNTDATQQAFQRANVTLMRADWTRRDARITAALARLGRNGVPVYVLLRAGREPLLLSEILTAGAVRDALAAP